MEIVCIELRVWEGLKGKISTLVSELSELKERYQAVPEKWLDSSDLCQLLNVSKRTLQTWRASGRIPYSMLGGKVYYRECDIAKALDLGTVKINQKV
ncbi:MAG: helix-turn-helix domain-containing protein [Bacteroidales bacterium]